MPENLKIPKRVLGTLLNSSAAGVVPRIGLEYLAIGRNDEISAILRDMENISSGMGAFRFIVGKYGSGKSFLLGLLRQNAVERGFITCDADLSPERRFQGTHGQGLSTYKELIKNLSCKYMPENNALPSIISNWLNKLRMEEIAKSGSESEKLIDENVTKSIYATLNKLRGFVNGFDFAKVLNSYYIGYISQDETLVSDALKWLRGEFSQKSELSETKLNVKSIINDQNWYEFLKLWAVFFKEIGYKGLLCFVDECVNLYKISNRVSRENNYEKILSMFNDTMQGKAEYIGFFLAGTPQMIEDTRRGVFSYEALRSRLSKGKFTPEGKRNLMSPLIYLEPLKDDEIFALCKRLINLHSLYYSYKNEITDENILEFLKAEYDNSLSQELLTPREITRDFLNILDILYSNPAMNFQEMVKKNTKKEEANKTDDFDSFFSLENIKL